MMDLIERYLGAVRWNLPAGKADDIIAELADVIANRIEEREDALDRPLRRDEISAVLKEFGHPLEVAGRYHGQRVLIGPEVFPFYWFVLRVVLAVVAVIKAIEVAGRAILGSEPVMRVIAGAGETLLHSLLINAAIVTLIFAVIEHTGWLSRYLERWKPEELPALRFNSKKRPRNRWEPVFEVAFGIAFLLWWFGAITIPQVPGDANIVRAAPVWVTLFWPVVALVAVGIVRGLVALLKPSAKPLRAALSIGRAAGVIAIAMVLHQAGQLVVVDPSSLDPSQAADVRKALDLAMTMVVVIVPIASIWQFAVELWQLARER